jgi:DNA repair protein RecN (Recombination protein N)
VHDGQTTSDIGEVRDDVRTTEIARMLGGQITETSRAHAQAMLATARAQEAQDAQDTNTATPAAGKAPRRRKEAA